MDIHIYHRLPGGIRMSSTNHLSSAERRSITSYTVGFILSLIFTLIPYYLVVNQVVTGRTLLITILGFAILQLIVQVVFFLHLGRGPKPSWNLYFFIGTIVAILFVVVGSIVIINNLHANVTSSEQTKRLINGEGIYQIGGELTGACKGRYDNHKVTFKDGKIDPLVTVASRCDTISFIEDSGVDVALVFGVHNDHGVYAGLKEIELHKNRTKTITLSQTGTYQFHDNMQPEAIGTFAVYEYK